MPVEFFLAVRDGQVIVIERRADLPLILHTFDHASDAISFYERRRGEPLPEAKRARILQGVNAKWQ
jgi:hypothetical protein